jgi:hypothetical protein
VEGNARCEWKRRVPKAYLSSELPAFFPGPLVAETEDGVALPDGGPLNDVCTNKAPTPPRFLSIPPFPRASFIDLCVVLEAGKPLLCPHAKIVPPLNHTETTDFGRSSPFRSRCWHMPLHREKFGEKGDRDW